MAQQQALAPWGRFTLVSKESADESDHLYFTRNEHRIGRNRARSDLVLDKLWISSVHCVVTLEDAGEDADAGERFAMKILDLSRNAVYVNEERVGKSNTAVLRANDTIHFTKPGLNTRTISPTVYKLEIFEDGFSEANTQLRNGHESQESTPNTQSVATPAAPAASAATPVASAMAAVRPTQTMAPSITIAPTQDMGSGQKIQKRSMDETHEDMDEDFTATGSYLSSAKRAASVSSTSGSSSKRQRAATPSDAVDAEAMARIQQSNQDLRRRLQESKERELVLNKNLSDAEIEILSSTSKLEACQEHGKKLQEELDSKSDEVKERERFIAQLQEEKRAQDAELVAFTQALNDANEKVKVGDTAIDDCERERTKLEKNLATVTAQLNSTMSKNATLSARVDELEKKTRALENTKRSVESGCEVVEEDKRGVQEVNDIFGNLMYEALAIFADVHKRSQKIRSTSVVKEYLALRQRLAEEDLASTEHSSSLSNIRNFSDSSLFLTEDSQPTPVSSSEVNKSQQEPDEAETLDQEAALASVPLPTLAGPREALQLKRGRTSQDADDEGSETRKMPRIAAEGGDGDDDEQDTPDQQRGDSEESAISVRSASKTPPAKPLRVTATPVHSQQLEGEEEVAEQVLVAEAEEEEVSEQAPVTEADAVEVIIVEDGAAEPEEEEGEEEAVDDEGKDKVTATKEPVAVVKADEVDDDKEDEEEDDDVVILDSAPAPAATGAALTKTTEDQDDSSDDKEKKKQENGAERDVTAAAEQEQEVKEDEDDEDENTDDGEPPMPTRTSTVPQPRWLPTISHDESLDSQANASEGAGIFDDETQLSP